MTDSEKLQILEDVQPLWDEADKLWERFSEDIDFEEYVSADYSQVFDALWELRGKAHHMLEWGSGLGVVTIMASRMGFQACGIEAEPRLVDFSRMLAERYDSNARFANGSFIPDEFEWTAAGEGTAKHAMMLDCADVYDELHRNLRDFDLVYAYPWPEEHKLYRSIMHACAAPHTILLTYDSREGMQRWCSHR